MPPAVPSKSKSDGTPMEHPPPFYGTLTPITISLCHREGKSVFK